MRTGDERRGDERRGGEDREDDGLARVDVSGGFGWDAGGGSHAQSVTKTERALLQEREGEREIEREG